MRLIIDHLLIHAFDSILFSGQKIHTFLVHVELRTMDHHDKLSYSRKLIWFEPGMGAGPAPIYGCSKVNK